MEEEWDLIDSLNSSGTFKPREHRPSLDFNRFHTMPEFKIEDEEKSVSPEQDFVADQVCERPTSEQVFDLEIKDHDFEFTLGDSKLMMNDTTAEGDDSNNENNELIDNNQNDESIKETIPFLSSLNSTNLLIKSFSTRESQVDKNTIWKNSTSGSSVPYMSNQPHRNSEEEEQEQIVADNNHNSMRQGKI